MNYNCDRAVYNQRQTESYTKKKLNLKIKNIQANYYKPSNYESS